MKVAQDACTSNVIINGFHTWILLFLIYTKHVNCWSKIFFQNKLYILPSRSTFQISLHISTQSKYVLKFRLSTLWIQYFYIYNHVWWIVDIIKRMITKCSMQIMAYMNRCLRPSLLEKPWLWFNSKNKFELIYR